MANHLMNVYDILFWFFSGALLLCGVGVVFNRHPVNSAMCLVLLFVCLAGLFVLLEAFFLAVIQILVYAGAVMVLFLFVIMLLDLKPSSLRRVRLLGLIGGVAVGGALVWELAIILAEPVQSVAAHPDGEFHAGIKEVVAPLFVKYMLPFEVVGLLLLVALVGVVLLSRKELK